jgi:hypothetical protein
LPPAPDGGRSLPDRHSQISIRLPESAPRTASVPPPSVNAILAARDDSTYFRILATAQAIPKAAEGLRRLTEWHDSFILTPDDPGWGRPTEQALREFLQKQSAGSRLEITSISCRSEGCEVQALDETTDVRGVPTNEGPKMLAMPLNADWPVGPSLRQQAGIFFSLGDRNGIMIMYKRVRPTAEAASP